MISLQSNGLSGVFSNTTVQKHQFFGAQLYGPTLASIHDYWKNHSFEYVKSHRPLSIDFCLWTFVGKMASLLFNMLSRLVIAFLGRSKRLLISWLQSPSAVILEPAAYTHQEKKKKKSLTVSIVFPSICNEVMRLDAMTLVF